MQLEVLRRGAADLADDRFGDNALASLIRAVGSEPISNEHWRQLLASIVVATTSHVVRDTAAIALVDRGASDCTEALVQVVRRPDLAGHKGTLLFALDELGAVIPLELVVQLIDEASYEATAEALLFFEHDRVVAPSDPALLQTLRDRLRALRASPDRDVSEAADVVLARCAAWPA